MEKIWREMDKFFTANKLFVAFCGLLIAVWLALQVVVHMRIIEIAKIDAVKIFSWDWPIRDASVLASSVSSPSAQVLKKSGTEVVVKVIAKQALERRPFASTGRSTPGSDLETSLVAAKRSLDCEASLTYYRSDNRWILGKVELK
jgi:hypothetical protein